MFDIETLKNTPPSVALMEAVTNYLEARAVSEVTNEKIDAIYAEVLEEFQVFDTFTPRLLKERGSEAEIGAPERITDHSQLYLIDEKDIFDLVITMAEEKQIEAGIRSPGLEHGYCHGLIARNALVLVENALIDVTAEFLGIEDPEDFRSRLLLDLRTQFLDLTTRMVVNFAGYEGQYSNWRKLCMKFMNTSMKLSKN